jgi:hypothetical protein
MRFLSLFAFAVLVMHAQEQDLEHAMQAARTHVRRLESSVPDFICHEQIISQLFLDGKLKKETRAESVLTTTRGQKDGHGTFSETRAEMRINGKPSRKNTISGPFVWGGGPAYDDLHFLFDTARGAACLNHRFAGKVMLNGKEALLIETDALDQAGADSGCRELRADSANKIWLEPKSLNVMRVESFNPPANVPDTVDLTLTVEYAAVSFEGAEYWLPSHFISRLDFPGSTRHLQYESFFTDYHKYGAESSFHVDGADH